MILYISSNDGSDTRIRKELMTLSKKSKIIYLGVGGDKYKKDILRYCTDVYFIRGKRNSLRVLLMMFFLIIRIRLSNKVRSIHIINEQLMIFFYPLLLNAYVVLDVFDSIFLKLNIPKDKWLVIKKITYWPIDKIIVTDENRLHLMPKFVFGKTIVMENFPMSKGSEIRATKDGHEINIFYSGTLSEARGTHILEGLLEKYDDVSISMAGWIYDKKTIEFSKNKRVNYLGVLSEEEVSRQIQKKSDFLFCYYSPDNLNNINASPNKLYDAIQIGIPLIINSEVKVSSFVRTNGLGISISSDDPNLLSNLYDEMKLRKEIDISPEFKERFVWERIENKLLKAHQLNVESDFVIVNND